MSSTIQKLKDPGSAITHFIAMLMATIAATPLLVKAMSKGKVTTICCLIFIASMILLYGASTIYHSFDKGQRINTILKKLDHAMIFVLIAGSYTPICLLAIGGAIGTTLMGIVWAVGMVGIMFKLCWVTCPKWLSSVIYIAMGWLCLLAISPIRNTMTKEAILWLMLGGVIYTVGGVLYAIKTPAVIRFNNKHKLFGTHEIFHLFVMAGSVCHFILIYNYIV